MRVTVTTPLSNFDSLYNIIIIVLNQQITVVCNQNINNQ